MALLILASSNTVASAQTCNATTFSGSYGAFDTLSGAAIDSTTTFSVTCNGLLLATVRLCIEIGPGNNFNSSGQRVLASGSNTVQQEYYSNSARSTIWGSWGSSIAAYSPGPAGVTYDMGLNLFGQGNATFTIYGRILSNQQSAIPGSYLWTANTSPGLRYGYTFGSSCPTGIFTAASSGSTWAATINANCYVSATSINFGTVGALTSNIDSTGTVSVQCTNTTPYKIVLNYGQGVGAGGGLRKMNGPGGTTVDYNLFKDASRTQLWGDNLGVNTNDSTGTGANQNFTVYARVPVQTNAAAGTYSDNIIVTVTY